MANDNLRKAKKQKNDEFYTQFIAKSIFRTRSWINPNVFIMEYPLDVQYFLNT